jgi:acyl-CoA hydrolase
MVFVALDRPDGKPTPVPTWRPRNDEDVRLQEYARRLMAMSKEMEREVVSLHHEATLP